MRPNLTSARALGFSMLLPLLIACQGGSKDDASEGGKGGSASSSTTSVGGSTSSVGGGTASGGGGGGPPIVYPADIDPAQAVELKALLAAATKQQLVCEFSATTTKGSPVDAKGLDYSLTVSPADLGGPDADARRDEMVLFSTSDTIPNPDDASKPIDGSESLLVAYIATVTPTLSVKGNVYDYAFHGVLTDNLVVTKSASAESIEKISFIKKDENNTVLLTIACLASQ